MYAASDATTEAARVFFISFTMLATLLLAQLIIGMPACDLRQCRNSCLQVVQVLLSTCSQR